ncbi:cytochrome c oxidase assembly protein [Stackebrandtia soli]|uniref:cytochrome c oxidase assembly protein n=1 Tax=Stackebrandtia soli TaxID=1892856 RepID=UPI0039E96C32
MLPTRTVAAIVVGSLLVAVVVAITLLNLGGGVITDAAPGLPARSPLVTWLVPALKLAADLAAVVVLGCAVAAAFFVDGDEGRIAPQSYRWLRVAGWAALGWAVIALAQLPVKLADTFATDLSTIGLGGIWSYVTDTEDGFALALTAVLALVAGAVALTTLSVSGAAFATVIAGAAALPAVFTGHSAASGDHQIAVDSMILHVLGALLWTGGLLALLLARRTRATAVRRYSRIAGVAFVAVAASGAVNAATRVPSVADLTGTDYGRFVLIKVAALVLLGGFGFWHRRSTIPALDGGRGGVFARLAAVEVVIMAATFGLAVALSRTPPPSGEVVEETAATTLLGFPMPGPLTPRALLFDWYPSVLVCAMAIAAIGLYLAGVRRLRRRGDSWPVSRTLLWTIGWLLAVFVTSSGVGRYSMVLFSVHMAQHMTLNMLIPILLVLSAPITLALRAIPPSSGRGPREWLLLLIHSRFVTAVSHPLIALGLYVFSLYMMYFTGLFEWAMRDHAGHLFMVFHFMAAGGLFFWLIIGPDPAPRRLPYPAKILLFFVSIVFHTIFGLTIMQSSDVIAGDWYNLLVRDWGSTPIEDQRAGGGIAWAFGEIPSLLVLGALIWQWSRSDDREARRFDRAADRAEETGNTDDDPLEQYNAYLAKLAEADRKAGLRD